MRTDIKNVAFSAASELERATGLLGWTSFTSGGMVIDGVAVRRTRNGDLTLSWPRRRDRHGREHPVVRPQDDRTRQLLEAAVFEALRIAEEGGT